MKTDTDRAPSFPVQEQRKDFGTQPYWRRFANPDCVPQIRHPGETRPIKNGFRFCLLFFPGLIVSAGCRARPALEEAASGNTADVLRAAGEKAVAISAASALSEPLWTFLIAAGIGLLGVGGVGVLLKARRFALALRLIRGALFLVRKRLRR